MAAKKAAPKHAAAGKEKKASSKPRHKGKKKLTQKQLLLRRRIAIVAALAALAGAGFAGVRLFLWEPAVEGRFYGAGLPDEAAGDEKPFDWSCLVWDQGGRPRYVEGGQERSRLGIDVSMHQGQIDWHAVRNDGISFAILRVGYRGTGTGAVVEDPRFRENLLGAQMAGLNVGVYFYSQATTVAEAEREADFVLGEIGASPLMYPIVFDFETAGNDEARIAPMKREERNAVAEAFCARIEAAGRSAMVYGNIYDLESMDYRTLWRYGWWLASYGPQPSADFPFAIWQYASDGTVAGIDGPVDMDIDLSQPLQDYMARRALG